MAGLPFSVFVETLMFPFLIALNAFALLWSCWHHDQSLMKHLGQGADVMGESEKDREP
ncbi:MAG: hypothetical protein O7D93_11865 [Acidobacteria bacterium]|nr:hypothetical protein [Acidobacteriota bacterium]